MSRPILGKTQQKTLTFPHVVFLQFDFSVVKTSHLILAVVQSDFSRGSDVTSDFSRGSDVTSAGVADVTSEMIHYLS